MTEAELAREVSADRKEIKVLSARLNQLLDKYEQVRQRLLEKKGDDPQIQAWVVDMERRANEMLAVTGKNKEEVAEAHRAGYDNDPEVRRLRLDHYHRMNLNLRAQLDLHSQFLEDMIALIEAKESALK